MNKPIVIILLICFAVLSVGAQTDNAKTTDHQRNVSEQSKITKENVNPDRAGQINPQADNLNAPVIEFDKMVHDYGTLTQNSDGNCTFKFVNTGREPLVLTNVKSS